jgi:hypothetical protein
MFLAKFAAYGVSLVLAGAGAIPLVHADEASPGCDRPWEPHSDLPASALRSIAASCASSEIKRLFYNRAYHLDLLGYYQALSGLDRPGLGKDDRYRFEAYRMFINLAEAFAWDAWGQRGEAAIAELNGSYDRAMEIADLRLRGHSLIADRLESRLFTE